MWHSFVVLQRNGWYADEYTISTAHAQWINVEEIAVGPGRAGRQRFSMIRLNARGVEKPSLPELKEKVRVSLNHCTDGCTVTATFGRQGFQFILYAARVLGVY